MLQWIDKGSLEITDQESREGGVVLYSKEWFEYMAFYLGTSEKPVKSLWVRVRGHTNMRDNGRHLLQTAGSRRESR